MGTPGESELVGRAALLASLCRAVDDTAAGRGGLVLLAGEPGIGKTALAAEVVRYARRAGLTAVWGACEDGGVAPGLWPWQQIVRAVTGRTEPFAQEPPDGPTATGPTPTGPVREPAPGGGEHSRLALFDRIAGLLLRGGRPLVAVLDDLQWADPASVLLLGHLGRRSRHEPLLLIGTYRDVELPADHPLPALPGAEVVVLGGLAAPDVGTLLERFGPPATAEAAELVHRRTGGNPFFVQQVARLRAAGGDNPAGSNNPTVPTAVGQTVARRLARLPDRTARVLGTAAVLGRAFTTARLAAVAAVPPAEVPALLAPAVHARIVARDGPDGYRFVHDLFREELVAGLDPARRAGVHLAAARALADGARPAELAWHHGQALPFGPVEPAVRHAVRAGEEAMGLLAYEEAARWWRQAVRLTTPDDPAALRLSTALAEAELRSGARDSAARRFAEVAEAARARHRPELLAAAALGLHAAGVRSGDSRREVVAWLERAEAALADRPPAPAPTEPPHAEVPHADVLHADAVHAEVLAALARELADGPERDTATARDLARRAADRARTAGDPHALATALFAQHDVDWAPGTAHRRLALADGLVAAAVDAHDPALEFEGALCRFVALLELADPGAADALCQAADAARRCRLPRARYLVRSRDAAWALLRGRFREAGQLSDEAAELAEAIGEPDGAGVTATQRIAAALTREGPAGVAAALAAYGESGLPSEFLPHWRCFGYLAAEEPEAAAAVLRALPAAEDLSRYRWRALAGLAFDVEIAVAAGVPEVREDRYRRLLPYARETIVVGGGVAVLGPVAFYLGLAATGPEAVRHLRDALDGADRLGARPLAVRARLELGRELLAREPTGGRGRQLLAQVLTAAEEMGLDWLRDDARATLARADSDHVFHRDGQLWTLAYRGRTVVLKDAKGLHDLALLLSCPGREVPATRLLGGGSLPASGSDELADDRARAAYRDRLDRLDEEIAEARERDDLARLAGAEEERDALIAELRGAYGLGGRPRRLGDTGERARTTVTARIRDTLRRIEREHPELGRHLSASVTTGRACAYRPAHPVRWQL
ncbi:AAA family ATPase [Kitasatospora sp. NPDC048545]|uniref:ATP-binding protein n=1 Tax=Kitasatospora sp. NPDC048545 TaxID=3157208 RepID=UPI0033EFC1B8